MIFLDEQKKNAVYSGIVSIKEYKNIFFKFAMKLRYYMNHKINKNLREDPQILVRREYDEFSESDYYKMIIAYMEDVPVGFIVMSIDDDKIGTIYMLYVDKDFRREGIGKTLVKKSKEFFNSNNAKVIILNTPSVSNDSVKKFYKKSGFKEESILYTTNL